MYVCHSNRIETKNKQKILDRHIVHTSRGIKCERETGRGRQYILKRMGHELTVIIITIIITIMIIIITIIIIT